MRRRTVWFGDAFEALRADGDRYPAQLEEETWQRPLADIPMAVRSSRKRR